MIVKNPVYLNADKTKAVRAGNPKASVLLAGRNATVPDEVAKRFNLSEDGAPADDEDPKEPQGTGPTSGPILQNRGEMRNANTPDGVNTAPGTAPSTPIPAANSPGVDHGNLTMLGRIDPVAAVAGPAPGVAATSPAAIPAAAAVAPTPTAAETGATTAATKTAAPARTGRKGRGR